MKNDAFITPVAIVGAGPYGVSIAAHLRSAGVSFRIFGMPMDRWRHQMPEGMFLKSEGFASNLSDPGGRYTLARYCAAERIPYRDIHGPVSLPVFRRYALAFQRELVPEVEEIMVSSIERESGWFGLQLADETKIRARKVVVATGLEHAAYVPHELEGLPRDLLSHSSVHRDLSRFQGMNVAVIGGGQSALETAALLAEQGASVRLLVRAPALSWNSIPRECPPSRYRRLRYPASGLGYGIQLWAYANVPGLFRYLPESIRLERVKNVLGPAGGWWLRERVVGRFPIMANQVVSKAEVRGSRAELHVHDAGGRISHLTTDHVIAATGYRFDLARMRFLGPGLASTVRNQGGVPVLSPNFESSVPGLYFTGFASVPWFGPVMRFLVGADYTARRVSRHLAAALLQQRSISHPEFAHAVKSGQSRTVDQPTSRGTHADSPG